MPDSPRLLPTQHGRVLTVTFNNPPRHFFDERMSFELDDLTRRLRRDPTVGAVVFTGQDSTYLTHFDIPDLLRGSRLTPFTVRYGPARALAAGSSLMVLSRRVDRTLRHTAARELVFMARVYASLRRLNRMDKVVVTAINGLALGMGCVFALACDIRLMAEDQQIGLPESALAILAGLGGTQRLVRMVGSSRALELLLDGRWITAGAAADLGLVHHVVAPQDLQQKAHALAERLARRSPVVIREVKRMVYDAGTRSFAAGMRREAAGVIATMTSAQAERNLSAYHRSLRTHDVLTDDAILRAWRPLLDGGDPDGNLVSHCCPRGRRNR